MNSACPRFARFARPPRAIFIFAAAAFSIGCGLVGAEEPGSSYSIVLDFPYTSKYSFRGQELSKASIQPSLEFAASDFYAGLWSNLPVTRNAENEVDFYTGYKAKLSGVWSLDGGATLYYYPELDTSSGGKRSTFEGYLGCVGNFKGASPGAYVYRDFNLKTITVQAQLDYSLALPKAGLGIDFSAKLGRVYAEEAEDYNYLGLSATLPYQLNDKASVYAGLAYTSSDSSGVKKDLFSYTVGVSLGF